MQALCNVLDIRLQEYRAESLQTHTNPHGDGRAIVWMGELYDFQVRTTGPRRSMCLLHFRMRADQATSCEQCPLPVSSWSPLTSQATFSKMKSFTRLLSGILFYFFGLLVSYYITIKPKKYLLYSQGLLNSLV